MYVHKVFMCLQNEGVDVCVVVDCVGCVHIGAIEETGVHIGCMFVAVHTFGHSVIK